MVQYSEAIYNIIRKKIKDIEDEIVINKYSKDYIVVNVGSFKILNSKLNDVTNLSFDNVFTGVYCIIFCRKQEEKCEKNLYLSLNYVTVH